jgi:hypothetical protein
MIIMIIIKEEQVNSMRILIKYKVANGLRMRIVLMIFSRSSLLNDFLF